MRRAESQLVPPSLAVRREVAALVGLLLVVDAGFIGGYFAAGLPRA